MITEINIYSDGTLISLNENKCLVPIATGTWAVLIDIVDWYYNPEQWRLPDECRFFDLHVNFIVRNNNGETRTPIPVTHLGNMGKTMQSIASSGYKPVEVICKEISEKIIEEYENEQS